MSGEALLLIFLGGVLVGAIATAVAFYMDHCRHSDCGRKP